MAVALDRDAIRTNVGGDFAGDYADGADQAEHRRGLRPDRASGTTFFGQTVPDTGDPELAKKLIAESGEAAPTLTFNFADTPVNQKTAAIVIDSLGKAGLHGQAGADRARQLLQHRLRPGEGRRLRDRRLGRGLAERLDRHPAAVHRRRVAGTCRRSTTPPSTPKVEAAQTETRPRQAGGPVAGAQQGGRSRTSASSRPSSGCSQTIAGDGTVGAGLYRWAAYGSWPYGDLVRQASNRYVQRS